MGFNELNSVENYIIKQLTGVNLNTNEVSDEHTSYGPTWKFKSAQDLQRSVNEVLIEEDLKNALIQLNPEIALNPDLADEVIYKLRAILISVHQVGLVRANEEFFKWLNGDKTMPFGENNRHVPIRLIDLENIDKNISEKDYEKHKRKHELRMKKISGKIRQLEEKIESYGKVKL